MADLPDTASGGAMTPDSGQAAARLRSRAAAVGNTTLEAATAHFEEIGTALGGGEDTCSISSGAVALRPGEPLDELMARADAELYRSKAARPTDGRGGGTVA